MEDSNKPPLRIHYTTYPSKEAIPAGTYFRNVRVYIVNDLDEVATAHQTAVELLNAAKDENGRADIPEVGRCYWGMRMFHEDEEAEPGRIKIYFLYNQKF